MSEKDIKVVKAMINMNCREISELKQDMLDFGSIQYNIKREISELKEVLQELVSCYEMEHMIETGLLEKLDGEKEPTEDYDINKIREYVKTKGYFLVEMADLEKLIHFQAPSKFRREMEDKYLEDADD